MSISARFGITAGILLIAITVCVVVALIITQAGIESTNEGVSQLRMETVHHKQTDVRSLFTAPISILRSFVAVSKVQGALDHYNQRYTYNPWLCAASLINDDRPIYIGNEDGMFVLPRIILDAASLQSISRTTCQLMIINASDGSRGRITYNISDDGVPVLSTDYQFSGASRFDSRKRPWYLQSSGDKMLWSQVYINANGVSTALTVAAPIYSTQLSRNVGVVAIDFDSTNILDYLRNISIAKSGRLLLTETESRNVLGTNWNESVIVPVSGDVCNDGSRVVIPNNNNDDDPSSCFTIPRLAEMEEPLIRDAVASLGENYVFTCDDAMNPDDDDLWKRIGHREAMCSTSFGSNRDRVFVDVAGVTDDHGLNLRLIILIPERDFLDKVWKRSDIAAILVAVLVFVPIALSGLAAAIAIARGRMTRSHNTAPQDSEQPFAIVFTDIQSSTALWAQDPIAMSAAVELHHSEIRELIEDFNGYEVKTIGDSFMVTFKRADDAIAFGVEIQKRLQSIEWNSEIFDEVYKVQLREQFENTADGVTPTGGMISQQQRMVKMTRQDLWNGLRVRVGVHHGHGSIQQDEVTQGFDYYGTVVNTGARVESVGHGGQVLVTEAAFCAAFLDENGAVLGAYNKSKDRGAMQSPPLFSSSVPTTNNTVVDALDADDFKRLRLARDIIATDLGSHALKGLTEPVRLFQCLPSILGERSFPSLRLHTDETVFDDNDIVKEMSVAHNNDLSTTGGDDDVSLLSLTNSKTGGGGAGPASTGEGQRSNGTAEHTSIDVVVPIIGPAHSTQATGPSITNNVQHDVSSVNTSITPPGGGVEGVHDQISSSAKKTRRKSNATTTAPQQQALDVALQHAMLARALRKHWRTSAAASRAAPRLRDGVVFLQTLLSICAPQQRFDIISTLAQRWHLMVPKEYLLSKGCDTLKGGSATSGGGGGDGSGCSTTNSSSSSSSACAAEFAVLVSLIIRVLKFAEASEKKKGGLAAAVPTDALIISLGSEGPPPAGSFEFDKNAISNLDRTPLSGSPSFEDLRGEKPLDPRSESTSPLQLHLSGDHHNNIPSASNSDSGGVFLPPALANAAQQQQQRQALLSTLSAPQHHGMVTTTTLSSSVQLRRNEQQHQQQQQLVTASFADDIEDAATMNPLHPTTRN